MSTVEPAKPEQVTLPNFARLLVNKVTVKHFVAGLLLVTIATYASAISQQDLWLPDDGLSYIQASGTVEEWQQIERNSIFPAERWVDAGEWQDLVVADDLTNYRESWRESSEFGINPSFYPWVLGTYSSVVGVTTRTGATLSLILLIATGVLLYFLANLVFRNPWLSLISVLIWAMAPNVIQTAIETRTYSLLALYSVTAVLAYLMLIRSTSRKRSLLLVAVASSAMLLGELSHYMFIPVIVGVFSTGAFLFLRTRDPRHLSMLGAAVVGGGIALWLQAHAIEVAGNSTPAYLFEAEWFREIFDFRIGRVARGLIGLLVPEVSIVAEVAGLLFIVSLLGLLIRKRLMLKGIISSMRRIDNDRWILYLVPSIALVFIVAVYVSQWTPPNHFGGKNQSYVYPFFAIWAVHAWRVLAGYQRLIAVVYSAFAILVLITIAFNIDGSEEESVSDRIQQSDYFIFDSVREVHIPQFLFLARTDAQMFAASPNSDAWNQFLGEKQVEGHGLYISFSKGTVSSGQAFEAVSTRFELDPTPLIYRGVVLTQLEIKKAGPQ